MSRSTRKQQILFACGILLATVYLLNKSSLTEKLICEYDDSTTVDGIERPLDNSFELRNTTTATTTMLPKTMDKRNDTVWQYWEGDALPGYAQLCQETVRRHNPGISLEMVNDRRMHQLFDDIHVNYSYLSVTHRSDYARCRLLKRYGGMWADVDTIALNSWKWLFDKVYRDGYHIVRSTWEKEALSPMSNIGPMRAETPGIKECHRLWEEMLKTAQNNTLGTDNIPWAANVVTIIEPFAKALKELKGTDKLKVFDLGSAKDGSINQAYMYPNNAKTKFQEIVKRMLERHVTPNQVAVVIIGHNLSECFRMYTREQAACSRCEVSDVTPAECRHRR